MTKFELCQGDCIAWLHQLYEKPIDMIFADWPDNIGLRYNKYNDNLSNQEYTKQLDQWLKLFCNKAKIVWISFNSRWILNVAEIAQSIVDMGWEFKSCVQTYSFYQHCKTDLGNAHRPLWRFRKPGATIYPEQVKIESWRQKYMDKRATPGGKIPGDSFNFTQLQEKERRDWHERAIQVGAYIVDPLIPDDHFDFARVTGNSKQRRSYHPTQLNEGLVERCILLSTKPGDLICDPFLGSGTTLRVCKRIKRQCIGIEIDKDYCARIAAEHNMVQREIGEWSRWELLIGDNENIISTK